MADAAQMLCGGNAHWFVVGFGAVITYATVQFTYPQIAGVWKWLTLVLFSYVITAFLAGPRWPAILRDTFLPSMPKGHQAWATLLAVLGTTISPYLFFWQASQEVEEEKASGEQTLEER